MIPGNPHPLLMAGGGDPLDDYGVIARSLRIRASANAYLTRTFAAGGNRKKWTLNWWPKFCRSILAASEVLIENYDLGTNHFGIFKTNDTIRIYWAIGGSVLCDLVTTRVFRDFGAFPNLHVRIDTTQAVAANRVRLYCNGEQVTAFTTATYPAQNSDLYFNAPFSHTIGRSTAGGQNFDGYNSFMAFVDDQSLDPSSFGLFHPVTGQWRPKNKAQVKAVVDAGGITSFFLPFDDTTNTTTLCADDSAKGNNWTPTNISLSAGATYDSMTDTPTSNFCTLNPLIYNSAGTAPTLSNANLRFTGTGASANVGYAGFAIPETGQWQWEVEPTGGASVGYAGVARTPVQLSSILDLGQSANDYAYRMSTGNKSNNNVSTAYGAAISVADTLGFVFDATARTLTAYKNGVSQGVMFSSLPAGTYLPGFNTAGGEYFDVNFGQRAFKYPIAGAKALNTKNLPMPTNPAVIKPSTAFVAVTDSGANVQTTLANARAGWVNYIEIFKCRNTDEGWRVRFSDDLANYLDFKSTAAKAAFPTLAQASYMGYALKVAATNGIATGRLTHVNGVADTVTDGLGTSRKLVILKNEATGTWYEYHPDLTAGKLLYIEQTVAETTDATIGSIATNSFGVAAALASGTYRWIAFAEVAGFLKLSKHIANANANGPFDYDDLLPSFCYFKNKTVASTNHVILDNVRDPYNQAGTSLMLNSSGGDNAVQTNEYVDMVSNGAKIRTTQADLNNTTNEIVYMHIAGFPFRYANAR